MAPKRQTPPRVALLIQGTRHYERSLLSGIADYANLHGPWQFFRNVSYLRDEDISPQALLRAWKPDALIIRESSPRHYDKILRSKLPIIYAPSTEPNPSVTNIIVDDVETGRLAARHLYENGFRNFAFCGVSDLFFWSRLRREGFCKEVEALGHKAHIFESKTGDEFLSWSASSRKLRKWLAELPGQTGLMACTDDFALLAQEACIAVNRSIPDEIALIGVGNDEAVCELAATPLSSVELNVKRAGYNAARFLDHRLKTKSNTHQTKPIKIVIEPLRVIARVSTDPAKTRDVEIAKAIRYINKQINQAIDVSDVVAATNLSRRTLYNKFQAATGEPISSFIRQRKIEHFSKLLLETNLTVAEIAYSMGYESESNISRLFKKYSGVTPLAYRRRHLVTA